MLATKLFQPLRASVFLSARQFSVSAIARNDKASELDLSDTSKISPEEVLQIGFRRMTEIPNYRKSEAELMPLLSAARKLGIAEQDIRNIYEKTSIEKGLKSAKRTSSGSSSENESAGAAPQAFGTDSGYAPGSAEESKYLFNVLNNKYPMSDAHRPFKYDDIPALGHLNLREHRVQREYNRVAAYELPQLSQYAAPYQPPSKSQVLRFRYTTYMGEEHQGESKVVVTFKTNDLSELNDKQRHKLRVLAGTRYDHETDTVKISSQAYPEAAQNVRYLGEIVRDLLAEAKDISKETFEDIPLNINHVQARKRRNKGIYSSQHQFPEEWKRPQDAPQPKTDAFTQLVETFVSIPKM